MKKKIFLLTSAAVALLLLSSCWPSAYQYYGADEAGFFRGIWHGIISPISLIGSIFNSDISVFEVNNRGFWYYLGFLIAVAGEGFSIFKLPRIIIRRDRDINININRSRGEEEHGN
ncbi:MAG: hypothetical protein FWC95_04895 [Defluviitaleaceae bacterium]|nr:hypothetical protein [Defluviitaleaceae bacterium]